MTDLRSLFWLGYCDISYSCLFVSEATEKVNGINNRYTPEDSIQPEFCKTCFSSLIGGLSQLFNFISEQQIFAAKRNAFLLPPILGKYEKSCENNRCFSVIDDTPELSYMELFVQFAAPLDSCGRLNEKGFRRLYQIFTLHRLLKQCHMFQQPLATCFIDFWTAFRLTLSPCGKKQKFTTIDSALDCPCGEGR